VQHKFLKYLSFKEAGIYPPIGVDYDFLCSRFNFTPLKVRRVLDTVTFLFKLFHNKVDCSSLLSGLCISFPQILSRSHRHFHVSRANTNVLNVVHSVYVRGWRVDRPMGEMLTGAESQGARHLLEESHRVNPTNRGQSHRPSDDINHSPSFRMCSMFNCFNDICDLHAMPLPSILVVISCNLDRLQRHT
jgi:hypothetical protein